MGDKMERIAGDSKCSQEPSGGDISTEQAVSECKMLVDQNHQISGDHVVERTVRFGRPAFILQSVQDFRSVVKGACGFSGGSYCHLIPSHNGQLAEGWSSYIQRLQPDQVYMPVSLVDLKPQLQKLITGSVIEVDYTNPVTWGGSPSLHSLLVERNPDGSPVACGPSWLVDVELASETPPISELQYIARFGVVPEIPIGAPRFMGVEKQLRELVHTVRPATGQGLVKWLLRTPSPDRSVPTPPYLAAGISKIHSPITLSLTKVWPEGQSFPHDRRDSSRSLANSLIVVGDGGSLEDACLYWNLRANRWSWPLPAWVTPEQAERGDVSRAIMAETRRAQMAFWPSTDDVNDLHLLSATVDTRELARTFLPEIRAVGCLPEDWIHFVDRRHRSFYGRSKESMTFSKGHASFVVSDDELPCPRPTQITVDIKIEAFRPPPTRVMLWGTNGPKTGRFGEAVIQLNPWNKRGQAAEEVSLGYPRTFENSKARVRRGRLPTFL